MTERPIIFSAPMVRAILDGRKTQTRRVLTLRGRPQLMANGEWMESLRHGFVSKLSLPAHRDDRLWVRETWQYAPQEYCSCPQAAKPTPCDDWSNRTGCKSNRSGVIYRADEGGLASWRSPIHMPRWASRITLEVTAVKVERLQDIVEREVHAEGIGPPVEVMTPQQAHALCVKHNEGSATIANFAELWTSIHGPGSWEENPWVAAITFKRVM